jgi:hypothetical protein
MSQLRTGRPDWALKPFPMTQSRARRRSVNGILAIDAVLLTTVPMVVTRRWPARHRAGAAA